MFDFYDESAKLTIEELRKFKELEGKSDEELEKLRGDLFDLAVAAIRITQEVGNKEQNDNAED